MAKMDYDDKSDSGVKAALTRNPNKEKELNSAPDGPYSKMHAEPEMVGMKGATEVKTGRGTFSFK